jgi:hypothetical protein
MMSDMRLSCRDFPKHLSADYADFFRAKALTTLSSKSA